LVTVFCHQAYVNVLPGQVPSPIWHLENETFYFGRFLPNFEHLCETPFELLCHAF
jgi:hypothetical protein